jgi:hypothetical protein
MRELDAQNRLRIAIPSMAQAYVKSNLALLPDPNDMMSSHGLSSV